MTDESRPAPGAQPDDQAEPTRLTVPVDGGDLAVARWGDGGTVAVAAHGITSSYEYFSLIGREVADQVTLLAPDLRGRGDSAGLPGPYGMARHADDLAAVLDHVDAADAVVVGHSMGGFVAAVFASRHRQRTRAALLIDGGPALGPPVDDADVDAVIRAVVGPALDRIERRFASVDEYRAFWRAHPAFADADADLDALDAYADHDLTGQPGALRSKVDADAVRADARDTLVNADVHGAVAQMAVPALLLLAQRGMLDDPEPLYPDALVRELRTRTGPLEHVRVPSTNHYTIGLSRPGARVVAHHLRLLASGSA